MIRQWRSMNKQYQSICYLSQYNNKNTLELITLTISLAHLFRQSPRIRHKQHSFTTTQQYHTQSLSTEQQAPHNNITPITTTIPTYNNNKMPPSSPQQSSHHQQQEQQNQFSLKHLSTAYNQIESTIITQPNLDHMIVLILGRTSSGKTVVQYYLCGDELVFGVDEKRKLAYLVPGMGVEGARVQRNPSEVTTRWPGVRVRQWGQGGKAGKQEEGKEGQAQTEQQIEQSHQNNIILVDIPDNTQLQPSQQTLLFLFLQKLFTQYPTLITLLLIIPQPTLDDPAQLIETFTSITQLLVLPTATQQPSQQQQQPPLHTIASHLSIIINKTPPSTDQQQIKERLQQINEELVQEQDPQVYTVIKDVIQAGRVYLVKQAQPHKDQQRELFGRVVDEGRCGDWWKEIRVNMGEVKEEMGDQEVVGEMVGRVGLEREWGRSVGVLGLLVRWVVGWGEGRNENEKEREECWEQVYQVIRFKLREIMPNQPEPQDNPTEYPNPKQHPPPASLLQSLHQLLLTLTHPPSTHPFLPTPATITTLLHAIKQSIPTCLPSIPNELSSLVYQCLWWTVNECWNCVWFVRGVVGDYKEGEDEEEKNGEEEEEKEKGVGQQVWMRMVSRLREAFEGFDLTLLQPTSTKPLKKKQKKKTFTIQKPITHTLPDLRHHLLKQPTHPNLPLLSQLLLLPHTHFKLYMLLEQLPTPLTPITFQTSFTKNLTIVKEISQILKLNRLFIDQIRFLVMIPDWNRIETAVDMVDREGFLQSQQTDRERTHAIQVLNELAVYARFKRRQKLANKMFGLVDRMVGFYDQERFRDEGLSVNERGERYNKTEIMQLREQKQLQLLENQMYPAACQVMVCRAPSQLPLIVEKVKKREELNQDYIDKANDVLYLLGQDTF